MRITRTKLLVAILVTICLANVSVALSQTDSSIESFWAKFKAAVIKSDKEAVATMVQFPIAMSYGIAAIRTKPQLLKRYRDLFTRQADATRCFAESKTPNRAPSNKKKKFAGANTARGREG